MKRAGIIYYLIRPIARFSIWMYYRKIHWSHAGRVPRKKPVILAVNHPTGFSEPVILAVTMWRPLYYLVRGDFFRNPVFGFLMRSLNMVPIYRRSDTDFRGVAQNLSTFEACYQTLRANRIICIFPEGSTRHEKKLRPLQKGLGRIAHGYMERFPDTNELYVVPVGVNYTYAEQPRTKVMIDFGEPINVAEIYRAHPDNRMRMVSEVTRTLHSHMAERIVRVDDQGREELAEYLFRLVRSDQPDLFFPVITSRYQPLARELAVAEGVRRISEEEMYRWLEVARPYFEQLKTLAITDRTMVGPSYFTWANSLLLAFTAPLVALGYLFCWPPWRLAKWIVDTKVKRIEFRTPVLQASALGSFLVYYLGCLAASLILGDWRILCAALILGWLGYASIWWQENLARWKRSQRFLNLDEKVCLELKQKRAKLVKLVNQLTSKSHS